MSKSTFSISSMLAAPKMLPRLLRRAQESSTTKRGSTSGDRKLTGVAIRRQQVRMIGIKLMKKAMSASDRSYTGYAESNSNLTNVQLGDVVVSPLCVRELQMGELLGEGAFSSVFAIESIKLEDKHVQQEHKVELSWSEAEARLELSIQQQGKLAVKHLKSSLLKCPTNFQRAVQDLEREADFLSSLNHPNIVTLRGLAMGGPGALTSGRHNEFFLVLDRLTDTLDNRIRHWSATSRPPIEVIVDYAHSLASALDYLHKQRIIFRDVKPGNVGFLTKGKEEQLQLFDLGLCRELPSAEDEEPEEFDTFHMSMAGTLRFMAPEMLLHQEYNCKVDVHSWAMTVFAMVSLQKPYEDVQSRDHLIDALCHWHVRPSLTAFDLPQSFLEVLQGAWAPSLQTRSTMQEVFDQLRTAKREMEKGGLHVMPGISSPRAT